MTIVTNLPCFLVQRLCAATFDMGLKYFGQSLDAAKDERGDVSVAVGALGAAVIVRSV